MEGEQKEAIYQMCVSTSLILFSFFVMYISYNQSLKYYANGKNQTLQEVPTGTNMVRIPCKLAK